MVMVLWWESDGNGDGAIGGRVMVTSSMKWCGLITISLKYFFTRTYFLPSGTLGWSTDLHRGAV